MNQAVVFRAIFFFAPALGGLCGCVSWMAPAAQQSECNTYLVLEASRACKAPLDELLAGIRSEYSFRRADAARDIGVEGATELRPLLRKMADEALEPEVLNGVLKGLGFLGYEEDSHYAREALFNGPVECREAAALACILLRDRQSYDKIVSLVRTGEVPLICAQVMAQLKVREALALFRELSLSHDTEARWMGLLGRSMLDPTEAVDELRGLLSLGNAVERILAINRLCWVQDESALMVMREFFPWHPCQNAYANSQLWQKLGSLRVRHRDLARHTLGDVLDAIEKRSNVRIVIGRELAGKLRSARFAFGRVRVLGYNPSALDVFLGLGAGIMLADIDDAQEGGVTWIVTDGLIRILSRQAAEQFWEDYWRAHEIP